MDVELDLELEQRARLHAALGDPTRLRIVEELVHSDLSPLEVRELVGIESNLLAHHLDVLESVRVVERSPSHGDRRRRYIRLRSGALELLVRSMPLAADSVLFVCTGNSARSQLAAAIWNGVHAVPATSAGTEPAKEIHPHARRIAVQRGLAFASDRPTALDEGTTADVIVTVCDRAHEQLRRRSGRPRRSLHWSIADPAQAGTPRAFEHAADELARRIDDLAPHVLPAPAR